MLFVFKTEARKKQDAEKWEARLQKRLHDLVPSERYLFVGHNGVHLTFRRTLEDVVSRSVLHTIRWPMQRVSFVEGYDGRRMAVPMAFNPARCIIYYDFETTGIENAHILQLGALKVMPDGTEKTFNLYVSPGDHLITEGASKVHGLTRDHPLMVGTRLGERRALQFLLSVCSPGDLLVAYFGYQFDHRVLLDRCEEHGVPVPPNLLFADPSVVVRTKCKAKLVDAARHYGVNVDEPDPVLLRHSWEETAQTMHLTSDERRSIIEELKMRSTRNHDALWDAVVLARLDQAMKREENHEYLL